MIVCKWKCGRGFTKKFMREYVHYTYVCVLVEFGRVSRLKLNKSFQCKIHKIMPFDIHYSKCSHVIICNNIYAQACSMCFFLLLFCCYTLYGSNEHRICRMSKWMETVNSENVQNFDIWHLIFTLISQRQRQRQQYHLIYSFKNIHEWMEIWTEKGKYS